MRTMTLKEASSLTGYSYHQLRRLCAANPTRCNQEAPGTRIELQPAWVVEMAEARWTGLKPRINEARRPARTAPVLSSAAGCPPSPRETAPVGGSGIEAARVTPGSQPAPRSTSAESRYLPCEK